MKISINKKRDSLQYHVKTNNDLQSSVSKELLPIELKRIGHDNISLEGIIDLYGLNKMLTTDTVVYLDIEDLYKIREYDRDKFHKGSNGRKTKDQYDKHFKYVGLNGINDCGVVTLRKLDDTISAVLSDGNNRLAIGRKQGIKKMPVIIFYT